MSITAGEGMAQDFVIPQEHPDYIAFDAEYFFSLNNADDTTGWNVVTTQEPFQSPAPEGPASLILDANTTNALRGAAIFDFPGGNDQDYVTYRLNFIEDGDYSLYMKYSLYNLRNDAGYGNEDSAYLSSEFGLDGELEETFADPRGPRDDTPSAYVTFNGSVNNEGTFGWWNATANGSDNSAENPDLIFVPELDEDVDFGVAAREAGVAFDRIVFHTNPSLTDAELDALVYFDPFLAGDPNDYNSDGNVDLTDIDIMRGNFGEAFPFVESLEKGDGNRDGFVDLQDFLQIRQALNPAAAAASNSVPEPTASWLALAAAAACAVMRRRRLH